MCVLSVPSSHSFSPPCHTPSLSFLSSSFSLLILLSDEQIELPNELFLWAPNAHPKLSICSFPPSVRLLLPPSHHPSISPLPPTAPATVPPATMFTCAETGVFRNVPQNQVRGCATLVKFESFNSKTLFQLVQMG